MAATRIVSFPQSCATKNWRILSRLDLPSGHSAGASGGKRKRSPERAKFTKPMRLSRITSPADRGGGSLSTRSGLFHYQRPVFFHRHSSTAAGPARSFTRKKHRADLNAYSPGRREASRTGGAAAMERQRDWCSLSTFPANEGPVRVSVLQESSALTEKSTPKLFEVTRGETGCTT